MMCTFFLDLFIQTMGELLDLLVARVWYVVLGAALLGVMCVCA